MNPGLGGVEKSLSGGLDVLYTCTSCVSPGLTAQEQDKRSALGGVFTWRTAFGISVVSVLLLKKSVVKEWLGLWNFSMLPSQTPPRHCMSGG